MEILTSAADIMTKGMGVFFLRLIAIYAFVGVGIIVASAYTAGQIWRLNSLPPARVPAPR